MGFFSYGAHPRHVAVAQRQRAALFCCASRRARHHERPLRWKASPLRDPSVGFWSSNCGPARPQADSSKVGGGAVAPQGARPNVAKPSHRHIFT